MQFAVDRQYTVESSKKGLISHVCPTQAPDSHFLQYTPAQVLAPCQAEYAVPFIQSACSDSDASGCTVFSADAE
jgi:hypothetical protein